MFVQLFIPDGRVTAEGLNKILAEIQCVAWISTNEKASTISGQKSLFLPSLEYLLGDGHAVAEYPYNETWDTAKDEISCIIHTSGTTGLFTDS